MIYSHINVNYTVSCNVCNRSLYIHDYNGYSKLAKFKNLEVAKEILKENGWILNGEHITCIICFKSKLRKRYK
jgi:hypothetical protein